MSIAEESKVSDRRRPPFALCIIALWFGLLGFYRVAQSPHFESYRTMDVVQLLVSGAGLGVSLMTFMLWFVRRRT